jgi:molecular chaperone DnaJ
VQTLKDEKKRAAFDQYGSASQNPNFDPNAFAGAGGFGGFGRAGGFPGFGGSFNGGGQPGGDLFEQLFGSFGGGGRTRSQQPIRGNDIEVTVSVSFLEACKGAKKTVTITPVADCKSCSGSGLKEGVKRKKCSTCGGTGARTFVVSNGFQMSSTCDACDGAGTTVPRGGECPTCGGAGKVRVKQEVAVDIPVGMWIENITTILAHHYLGAEEGMALRLPNLGDAPLSNKGPRGDLFIRLNVMPSSVFKRQGANLYYQARIPFHRALLGGVVRVPTLDGDVDVRIPGGTQQGEEMVLKGRGVSYLNSAGKGDLFVRFFLQLPRYVVGKFSPFSLNLKYIQDLDQASTSSP